MTWLSHHFSDRRRIFSEHACADARGRRPAVVKTGPAPHLFSNQSRRAAPCHSSCSGGTLRVARRRGPSVRKPRGAALMRRHRARPGAFPHCVPRTRRASRAAAAVGTSAPRPSCRCGDITKHYSAGTRRRPHTTPRPGSRGFASWRTTSLDTAAVGEPPRPGLFPMNLAIVTQSAPTVMLNRSCSATFSTLLICDGAATASQ